MVTQSTDIDDIFDNIKSTAWRHLTIKKDDQITDQTIHDYLIDTIKLHNHMTDPDIKLKQQARFENIMQALQLTFQQNGQSIKFWDFQYRPDINCSLSHIFLGRLNHQPDLKLQNTPRQQQRILNMREIFRFKDIFTRYTHKRFDCITLNYQNYHNDDVIKALSLSGTFFIFDREFNELFPIFSGMLIPHQQINDTHYFIHSCLHGALCENLDDLFFVPFGLAYTNDMNPLFDYAFQVKSIFSDAQKNVQFSNDQIKNPGLDYEYSHPDYAMIEIKAQSLTQTKNLKTILNERQSSNIFEKENLFLGFHIENNLPDFLGNHISFSQMFNEFCLKNNQTKYYLIGRPGDGRLSFDESGFVIVSNIQNDQINNIEKSDHDDPHLFMPESTQKWINQLALDIPSVPGMSGGIVLQSLFIKQNDQLQRICRSFGTLWGSERIYIDNKINGLYSIINKIIN